MTVLAPLLILSILGLAIGPAFAAIGRGRDTARAVFDGLTLGLVPALIFTRLLPHALEELGAVGFLLFVAGWALVAVSHRGGHGFERKVGHVVVLPTLAIHALADGAGLALSVSAAHGERSGLLLGIALVLHRLPEGLFLWTTFSRDAAERPIVLRRVGFAVAILAVATTLGAFWGQAVLSHVREEIFDGIVAFGLGAMVRVVVHEHGSTTSPRARAASAFAFVAGIAAAIAIPAPNSILAQATPRELSVSQSLGPLFIETAPAFVIGAVAVALLRTFAPGGGALAGLDRASPRPRSLVLAVAAPALALDAAIVSVRLLGVPLTLLRLLGSLLVAFAITRLATRDPAATEPRRPFPRALAETVAETGAWYVVGLLIAVVLEAAVEPSAIGRLRGPAAYAVAALAAIPLHVGAHAAIPVVAILLHKGLGIGPAIVFSIIAPIAGLPRLRILGNAFGVRVARLAIAITIPIALATAALAERIVAPASIPEIHPLVAHDHVWIEWLPAVLAIALVFGSMARLGARRWFASLAGPEVDHDHDHSARDQARTPSTDQPAR
jgi:zinc transporter ZupT